jgi:hypothetical protein
MIAGLNGEALAPIAIEAWEPAFAQAQAEWPKWTHASVDSMRVWVTDVEAHKVRVALSVGGIRLIQDSRNKSGKDYAPYIEFNGTKTAAPGTIQRAVEDNRDAMKQIARAGALALLKGMGR